ncbi:MAG: sulfurtransferase complex subunit TusD [Methylococcaceae bacterium]|nr:MAG: sulfurtransferase complex subunit TusD [Methylococcaceae bacterium]
MKFALMINGGPYTSQGANSAYGFAVAALAQGHEVLRVFFYGDGVYNAMRDMRPPADEPPLLTGWQALADRHGVDLVICSAAAERRGVLGIGEDVGDSGIAEGFRVAGLGLWVDACLAADRVLVFHG